MGNRDTAGDPAGLCRHCVRCRVVTTDRSRFLLCERSLTDPRYPKYPVLPVLSCQGYEPRGGGQPPSDKLNA